MREPQHELRVQEKALAARREEYDAQHDLITIHQQHGDDALAIAEQVDV